MNRPLPLFPVPLHCWRGEGGELSNKVQPGTKGEGGGRCFLRLHFISHDMILIELEEN